MNNKTIVMHDGMKKMEDVKFIRGHVVAYVHGTDTVLFEKDNKVILPGSTFTALKHFRDLNVLEMTPTYNQTMGLDNPKSVTNEKIDSYIWLFAVGTDGCGAEASQVQDVDYTKWIAPGNLVPFRYPASNNDLSEDLRKKYFGRKTNPVNATGRIAYYFKAFDNVQFKQQYIDGTEITGKTVYDTANSTEAETFVEIKMSITNKDCREFFANHEGLDRARINSISLLSAVETEIDGYKYYQEIRPVTKLNFPTEALVDETKGIDIIYSLFY